MIFTCLSDNPPPGHNPTAMVHMFPNTYCIPNPKPNSRTSQLTANQFHMYVTELTRNASAAFGSILAHLVHPYSALTRLRLARGFDRAGF